VIELRLGRSRARGAPPGHLLLTTIRSHDQFNTTVCGGCAAAYHAETNVLAPLDSVRWPRCKRIAAIRRLSPPPGVCLIAPERVTRTKLDIES